MEKIPSWIERLLLPKLNEITGELKAIHTRIDAVEKEITSLRNEMLAKFEAADTKIESLSKETQKDIKSLVNLHKIFFLAIKTPVPLNFLKLIIRIPANFIFDLIFISSFAWMQLRCFCRSPWQLLHMGIGNLKVFYSSKQPGGTL